MPLIDCSIEVVEMEVVGMVFNAITTVYCAMDLGQSHGVITLMIITAVCLCFSFPAIN